jgi:hypothetical protein
MSQSALVALIVVSAFGVGVFTGRAMFSAPAAAPAPASAPMAAAAPAAAPTEPAHTPFPSAAAADPDLPSGTVAEVMQVPNYTYLRITTPRGDVWAAVSSDPQLATGQKVSMATASKMEGFASKTLGRTFDEIWFGQLAQN